MIRPIRAALKAVGPWLQRAGFISLSDLDAWMDQIAGYSGNPGIAGVVVNQHSALTYNPVLAAANIIAQDFASFPINVFGHGENGARIAVDATIPGTVAYKLAYEPNPMMSSYTWRSVMMGHAIWRGNAISLLNWNDAGRLDSIFPVHPDRVKWKVEDDGRLWYYVRKKNGDWQQFTDEDVLHIRGLGGDGISGYDIVSLLQESLGVPIAATRFGARYFANDATPGVILKHPGKLSPAAHKNIRESFDAKHKGVDNSHVTGIIEEGMTVEQLECKATDAQLLETRRFGTEDVSRFTRIPLHMLADLSRSTNNNIEHQGLEYGKFCQRPWKTNWEQELNRKLFYDTRQFPWIDISELGRGDALSRAQANQIKFQNGVLDIDEWRADDGLNPLPNNSGKVRIIPLNMQQLPGTGAPMMTPPQPKEIAAPKEGK